MTPPRNAAKTGPAAAKVVERKPVARKPPAPKASGPAKRAKPAATSPLDDLKSEARSRAAKKGKPAGERSIADQEAAKQRIIIIDQALAPDLPLDEFTTIVDMFKQRDDRAALMKLLTTTSPMLESSRAAHVREVHHYLSAVDPACELGVFKRSIAALGKTGSRETLDAIRERVSEERQSIVDTTLLSMSTAAKKGSAAKPVVVPAARAAEVVVPVAESPAPVAEAVKFPRSPEVLGKLIELSKEYAIIHSALPARVLKHVLPVVLEKCKGDLGKLMEWHKEIVGLLSYYNSRVGGRYVVNFAGSDYHDVGVLPDLVAACESPKDLDVAARFLQFFNVDRMDHDGRSHIGALDNFLRRAVPKVLAKAKTPAERDAWRQAIVSACEQYKPYLVALVAGNVVPAILDKCETPADLLKWNEKVNFVVGIDSTGSGDRIDVESVVSRGLPALIEACADLKEFERVTGSNGVYGYANALGDATEFMLLIAQSLKSA